MPRSHQRTESGTDGLKKKSTKSLRSRARENTYLFLESISIRGCNRIVKAQSRFIRHLWICYLVFTSLFLWVSVMRLVSEYWNYSVNIQTYVSMDAPADFPAITFCNHQPFSEYGYELWRQGQVISPTKFNHVLRQEADHRINASRDHPYLLPPEAAQLGFVFDSVKLYYQNLDWPYPKQLGHQRNESIYMCLFRYLGEHLVIGGSGCHDDMIRVSVRSHPHHFNCHTVSIAPRKAKQVQEVGLIIWLGPQENYDASHRQAFLLDLFEQAYGLRVAIHEPGQLANLDSHGIQIEPGRMNELNFEAVRHIHMRTPRNPCITKPESKYKDLDETYDYEFELCLNTLVQAKVVEKCRCLYAYLPRIAFPNSTLPYCGRFLAESGEQLDVQGVFERKQCATDIMSQAAHLKKSFETEGLCLRRCESVDYVSTVSVTTWRSTQWQLYWSQETAAALDSSDTGTLASYFRLANLSSALGEKNNVQSKGPTGQYGFSDRYTYVLVKRKSNDTIVKAENLVLTFNALVSRIGGLCSLYIGMTFAVVIELIEFLYIAIYGSRLEKKKSTVVDTGPVSNDATAHNNNNRLDSVPENEGTTSKACAVQDSNDTDQLSEVHEHFLAQPLTTDSSDIKDEHVTSLDPLIITNKNQVEDRRSAL